MYSCASLVMFFSQGSNGGTNFLLKFGRVLHQLLITSKRCRYLSDRLCGQFRRLGTQPAKCSKSSCKMKTLGKLTPHIPGRSWRLRGFRERRNLIPEACASLWENDYHPHSQEVISDVCRIVNSDSFQQGSVLPPRGCHAVQECPGQPSQCCHTQ